MVGYELLSEEGKNTAVWLKKPNYFQIKYSSENMEGRLQTKGLFIWDLMSLQ